MRMPAELRAVGATQAEWRYEEIAEWLDAMPDVFRLADVPFHKNDVQTALRVVTDFERAGLIRQLDTRIAGTYARCDATSIVAEPRMHIYRAYGHDGRLLYIGCTSFSITERASAHAREKSWWSRDVARVVPGEVVVGWRAGLAAESEAIRNERPLNNRQHNYRSAVSA